MNNHIFDYKLPPSAFKVYAALVYKMNSLHCIVMPVQEIADVCRMSPTTVKKAIGQLMQCGLVSQINRFGSLGYRANRYFVTVPAGGWFKVEREVFRTAITPVQFLVFCYIKKCMGGKSEEAYPSLRSVVTATGLSHKAVVDAVKCLHSYSFINRIRRRYRRTRAFRHNRYIHFKCNCLKKGTKKARCEERALSALTYLPKQRGILFDFCFYRGGIYFGQHILDPQTYSTKRKTIISISMYK